MNVAVKPGQTQRRAGVSTAPFARQSEQGLGNPRASLFSDPLHNLSPRRISADRWTGGTPVLLSAAFLWRSRRLIALTVFGWSACMSSLGQSVLPNGSFEDGHDAPTGWHALAGGTIRTGQAHHGQRFLHGKSSRGAVLWESDRLE